MTLFPLTSRRWLDRAVMTTVVLGLGLDLGALCAQSDSDANLGARERSAAARRRGIELGYNLDYEPALAAFRDAAAADSSDPSSHLLMAGLTWVRILFERGAVTVDDYLGDSRSEPNRPPPSPALDRIFHDSIRRATDLATARLRAAPDNVAAHYDLGSAAAFEASYGATVSGSAMSGLGDARRAFNEHERVLALDPSRKDAGLVVGLYRYTISTLSPPMRFLSYMAGFGGGRERGLKMVEDAAAYPSDVQTNARFMLVLLYTREERFADARKVIGGLQRDYPRNRLLWLEAGQAAIRAGGFADARAAIEEGRRMFAAESRPRARGEDARWALAHATACVALGDTGPVAEDVRIIQSSGAPDWVRGRAEKERGKAADLAGDRRTAIEAYQRAEKLCTAGKDQSCADEAKRLVKSRFQVRR